MKGYFPAHKIPINWVKGQSPKTASKTLRMVNNITGFKKGDPELYNHISDSIACMEWILKDPEGNTHIVTKLHKFCEDRNISQKLRYKSYFNKPMKRGKSKGWCVISVQNIRDRSP
jgi:hypothetical protein